MTNIKAFQKFAIAFGLVFLASQVQAKPIVVNEKNKKTLEELNYSISNYTKTIPVQCYKVCDVFTTSDYDSDYYSYENRIKMAENLKKLGYNVRFELTDITDLESDGPGTYGSERYEYSLFMGNPDEKYSVAFLKELSDLKDEKKIYGYKKLTPDMDIPKFTVIGKLKPIEKGKKAIYDDKESELAIVIYKGKDNYGPYVKALTQRGSGIKETIFRFKNSRDILDNYYILEQK